ncbi:hypothetical protein J2Y58_001640 [Sphingomonas sp. BE138]|uniref:hypothetical protein n=1 Tax=Sphingomonas sp. BE138 TaxID=2817845 RepID=UPI00285EED39|nr:hypothetical protein [Sphingomonas sp. BE138]
MIAAVSRACASVIVVAKLFQLFHPIGGRGARSPPDMPCALTGPESVIDAAIPAAPDARIFLRLTCMPWRSLLRDAHVRHRFAPSYEYLLIHFLIPQQASINDVAASDLPWLKERLHLTRGNNCLEQGI